MVISTLKETHDMTTASQTPCVPHKTIRTVAGFQNEFGGLHNFLLAGECVPFRYTFPSIETLVDVIRHDDDARIRTYGRDDVKDAAGRDEFRRMPIEKLMETPFSLAHFKLARFCGAGKLLEGFEAGVMEPWRAFLTRAGFTFERCYPIFFISGPHGATEYHMDCSHVLAYQLYGTKIFSGLKDPDHFSPIEDSVQKSYRDKLAKPELADDEVLAYTMKPGDALWNQLLTPHWVNAGDDKVAASLNLSHGMLRYQGRLTRNEQRLDEWWNIHPDEAWREKPKS